MKLWEKGYREEAVTKLMAGQKAPMIISAKAGMMDPEKKTGVFTISTPDRDASRDIMEPEGVKLDRYKQNPVVLWAHDHRLPPIAKTLEVEVTKAGVAALAQFATDINPQADMIFRLYAEGYLNATSVGFFPLEYEKVMETGQDGKPTWMGGLHHKSWELFEWSAVPVPDNPNALAQSAKAVLWMASQAGMMDELDKAMEAAGIPNAIKASKLALQHPQLLESGGLMAMVKTATHQAITDLGLIPGPSGSRDDTWDDPAVMLAVDDLVEEVRALGKALRGQ